MSNLVTNAQRETDLGWIDPRVIVETTAWWGDGQRAGPGGRLARVDGSLHEQGNVRGQ